MADPFRPDAKSQLLREAQVGLSIVAILLVLLVYVAFYRITGRGRHLPDHVRNAPVAELVWPGGTDDRVAVREIEMTAQEFRDTRMPKMLRSGPENAARLGAKPVSKPGEFSSPYHSVSSDAAMAEKKTSRPKTPLDSPNFSPDSKFGSQNPSRPKVAIHSAETLKQKSPFKQSQSPKSIPEKLKLPTPRTFESGALNPLVASSSIPPADDASPRVDSKIELVSMESEGNDFKPALPTKIAAIPTKMKIPEVVPSNTFQLKHEITNEKANQFDLAKLNQTPIQKIEPVQLVSDANNFRVESTPNVESSLESKKPSLSMADQSLSPASKVTTKSSPVKLSNPFLDPDPVLNPSVPVVDPHKVTTNTKRLPRTGPVWRTPLEPKPSQQPEVTEATARLEYTTKSGDSFWSVSQQIYNDGRYFRALYKHNQPHVPEFDSLAPGTKLATPAREDLIKLWPDLCPGAEKRHLAQAKTKSEPSNSSIYVTQQGDTVFDIARRRLGQASRYSDILKLNQAELGRETSHLTPLGAGVRLVMPR